MKPQPPITHKVHCPDCNAFCGFLRMDGSGPYPDACALPLYESCRVVSQLRYKYEPKLIAPGVARDEITDEDANKKADLD